MPRVKVDYLVSFSNEDPEHPASNLLSWEVGKRRWLCRAGEPSCSVVLQLTRAVQISAIQIGSYHAAVVEVLVGRSETPDAAFEVLVPSSVFLTPSESRREPVDRVRSFSGDQLAPAASQRWDRVRVVCRQPYNKQCKYGLSFIQVYEPESSTSLAPSAPLPAARAIAASTTFGNSSSDEEDYRPGQLFAAARGGAGTSTGSQIRQATSQILKNISDSAPKIVKSPIVKNTASTSKQNVTDEPSSNRHRDSLMYTDDEDKPHSKIDSVVQRHHNEKAKEKEAKEAKEKVIKERKEKENVKQSDSHDSTTKKDDQKAKKDDKAGDYSAKKHDKLNRNDLNTSRNYTEKKDDTRRDDQKNKYRDDQTAKRDDRSKDDQNKHRHNDSTGRPGRSDDRDDFRNRDKMTPSKQGRDGRGDQHRTATKRARPANGADGELRAGPVSSSPHSLLAGAALVLSGYVHPRRGHIRQAAGALGATVLPDWSPRATHLICAFPKTPKLRQALASNPQTPIATGDWVEKCCELRRLLPWQWFATEPARRVPMPDLSSLPDGDTDHTQDEDVDTDDEIERVQREQKKRRRSSTPNTEVEDNTNKKKDDSTDDVEFVKDERIKGRLTVHDSDSEDDKTINASRSDDEGPRDRSSTQMEVDSDGDATEPEPEPPRLGRTHSPLPSFLDGHTFYIEADVATAGLDPALLARYVRAYGGVLLETWSEDDDPVDYVLCASDEQSQTRGRHVRADWLWRCHAERRLCSPDRYLVRPADT